MLERGLNLCVWFDFDHPVAEGSADTAAVRGVAEAIGGWLDGGSDRMLVFTVPLAAGFAAVAAAFDQAVAQYSGSQWLYGNVNEAGADVTALG